MPKKIENPHPLRTVRRAMRSSSGGKVNQEKFAELLGMSRATIQAIEQGREDLGGRLKTALAEKVFDLTGGVVHPFKLEFPRAPDRTVVPGVDPAPGEALDFEGNPYTKDSYRRWLEFKAPPGEKDPTIRESIKGDLLLRMEAVIDAAGESAIREVERQVMRLLQGLRKSLKLKDKIDTAMERLAEEKAETVNVADLEIPDLVSSGYSTGSEPVDREVLETLRRDLESKGATRVKLVRSASWPIDLLADDPEARVARHKLKVPEGERDEQPQIRLVCTRADGTLVRTIRLFKTDDDGGGRA